MDEQLTKLIGTPKKKVLGFKGIGTGTRAICPNYETLGMVGSRVQYLS